MAHYGLNRFEMKKLIALLFLLNSFVGHAQDLPAKRFASQVDFEGVYAKQETEATNEMIKHGIFTKDVIRIVPYQTEKHADLLKEFDANINAQGIPRKEVQLSGWVFELHSWSNVGLKDVPEKTIRQRLLFKWDKFFKQMNYPKTVEKLRQSGRYECLLTIEGVWVCPEIKQVGKKWRVSPDLFVFSGAHSSETYLKYPLSEPILEKAEEQWKEFNSKNSK